MKPPKIIGHRGAPRSFPENTPQSVAYAAQLGADGVEFDIHLSKDGELIVYHDAILDRTTNIQGAIEEIDWPLLKQARTKYGHLGIARLCDVLDALSPYKVEIQLELKANQLGSPYDSLGKILVQHLQNYDLLDRLVLTSFSPSILRQISAELPQCKLLASLNATSITAMGGLPFAIDVFEEFPGCILAVHKDVLKFAWDVLLQTIGIDRIGVWVVNTDHELEYWLKSGVRHIITDDPAHALTIRKKLQA